MFVIALYFGAVAMYIPIFGYDSEVLFMHENTQNALLELRVLEVRGRTASQHTRVIHARIDASLFN